MSEDSSNWFEEVRREPRLADKVADMMLDTILDRNLQPGDRLPTERELGQQFGVSRTVVREAVRTLAGRGVIEVRTGSGIRVAEADASSVRESLMLFLRGSELDYLMVHEVRTLLEVEVARLAAERATQEDLERLDDALRALELVIDDSEAASARDMDFHRAVATCAHNPLYLTLLDSTGQAMREVREGNLAVGVGRTLADHREIVARIAAGDSSGAREAMRVHLEGVATLWRKRTMADSSGSESAQPD